MEKCKYQYQLGEIKGCKFNGALCDFQADVTRCAVVRDRIRICPDLQTVLPLSELRSIQAARKVVLNK